MNTKQELADAKKGFTLAARYTYPFILICFDAALASIFLLLWSIENSITNLAPYIPSGPVSSSGSFSITQLVLSVSFIIVPVTIGGVLMYYVFKHHKEGFLKYYIYFAFGAILFSAGIASIQYAVVFFPFVVLPAILFTINAAKPNRFVFAYAAICYSAIFGSLLSTILPYNYDIIFLLAILAVIGG